MRLKPAPRLVRIVSGLGKIAVVLTLRPFSAGPVYLARVETGTGFGVFQQVMGGRDGLESRLCPCVVGVQVGMAGAHQLAIRLLDFIWRGGSGQAERLIGIDSHPSAFPFQQNFPPAKSHGVAGAGLDADQHRAKPCLISLLHRPSAVPSGLFAG